MDQPQNVDDKSLDWFSFVEGAKRSPPVFHKTYGLQPDQEQVVAFEFEKIGITPIRSIRIVDKAVRAYRTAKKQKFSLREHRRRLEVISDLAKRLRQLLEYNDGVLELLLEPEIREASDDFEEIEDSAEDDLIIRRRISFMTHCGSWLMKNGLCSIRS